MSENIVTQLPPTLSVKDPDTRQFLDALVNHLDLRGGSTNPESPQRFVTLGELQDSINAKASSLEGITGATGGSGVGGVVPGQGARGTVEQLISRLEETIRQGFLYQFLQSPIQYIDMGPFKKIADAGIQSESFARSNKDNAIAGAINTIWANIGGDSALIQDGQLAQVSPVAASATKWNQLQATVDGLEGNTDAIALVRQDFEAYANSTNGKIRAAYGVRVEVGRGGQRVAGGFGIVAEADGSGSDFIDFGVSADRFWISPPTRTTDGGDAAQIANPAPNQFPFIALSTTQTVGGVTYQPGVYIRNANIANAAIDTAKIVDASITNAKIQDLSVDTLKIAGGSVTTMTYQEGVGGSLGAGGGEYVSQVSVTMPYGSSGVVLTGSVLLAGTGGNATVWLMIGKTPFGQVLGGGSSQLIKLTGVSVVSGFYSSFNITAFDASPAGGYVYWLAVKNPNSGPGSNVSFDYQAPSITAIGGKR